MSNFASGYVKYINHLEQINQGAVDCPERMIREVIREYVSFEGYEFREDGSGIEAIELCRKEDFDVVVLDLMMPGIDGFTTYEKIRKTKQIPAIVLSAKGEEYDKLYGFQIGIDDYMVKPFSPRELMARIKVIISRNSRPRPDSEIKEKKQIEVRGLLIDPEQYQVLLEGEKVENMTLREFDLLCFLGSNPRIVFTREQLLDRVWGYDYVGDGRTVDTHIKMLRRSLGKYRDYIVTARGVGYKFDAGE